MPMKRMFVRIRFPPITEDVLLQAFEVSPAAAILIWSKVTLYWAVLCLVVLSLMAA